MLAETDRQNDTIKLHHDFVGQSNLITAQTAEQTSFFESKLTGNLAKATSRNSPERIRSQYSQIATRNLKFEKFVNEVFKSKMSAADVKDHIVKYVQAIETNYNELIRSFKDRIVKAERDEKKIESQRTNARVELNELESLFVECIEEVRKEIMRRRLKNEIYTRKKFHNVDQTVQEARDFEESLLRLAQLAKNRVRIIDFTQKDKYNLLDLFVNNEKTLLKIYEALFPHRTANYPASADPQTMAQGV